MKTCPKCGSQTHRNHCTRCVVNEHPVALTGDTQGDDINARMEAGEDLDLDAIFNKENYVPVPKEGE